MIREPEKKSNKQIRVTKRCKDYRPALEKLWERSPVPLNLSDSSNRLLNYTVLTKAMCPAFDTSFHAEYLQFRLNRRNRPSWPANGQFVAGGIFHLQGHTFYQDKRGLWENHGEQLGLLRSLKTYWDTLKPHNACFLVFRFSTLIKSYSEKKVEFITFFSLIERT